MERWGTTREEKREREFIYQVHNIDNTYQLVQWQAASGGISPSQLAAQPVEDSSVYISGEPSSGAAWGGEGEKLPPMDNLLKSYRTKTLQIPYALQ